MDDFLSFLFSLCFFVVVNLFLHDRRKRAKAALDALRVLLTPRRPQPKHDDRVKVTNFMCHHNLEVELGPRINFIVGENGSGKSAVLTAMCLTLGANSRKTERSVKGLKGFIREGANFAKLEVTIRNMGPDALDVESYGNSITVERTINAGGSAPFKIKNQWGKDVGSSRDQLTRITDHFNIDVENPIVVMSQDASRMFLHSGKDSDKYKFFVKATLLEEIQNKLQYVRNQVAEMDKLIEEKEEELPQVEAEVERLEEEANSFRKMEEYRANVEQFRNRLAWAEVHDSETVCANIAADLDNFYNHVTPKLEEELKKCETTVTNCERRKTRRRRSSRSFLKGRRR